MIDYSVTISNDNLYQMKFPSFSSFTEIEIEG